jgi:hypothetical protein
VWSSRAGHDNTSFHNLRALLPLWMNHEIQEHHDPYEMYCVCVKWVFLNYMIVQWGATRAPRTDDERCGDACMMMMRACLSHMHADIRLVAQFVRLGDCWFSYFHGVF